MKGRIQLKGVKIKFGETCASVFPLELKSVDSPTNPVQLIEEYFFIFAIAMFETLQYLLHASSSL
jgi:hypothetical protein